MDDSHLYSEWNFSRPKLLKKKNRLRIWWNGRKNTTDYKWCKRFTGEHENKGDDEVSGRSKTKTSSHVADVKEFLARCRRIAIREIVDSTDCSCWTVLSVVHDQINMGRVCAWWIPKLLNGEQKRPRVECCGRILTRYERQGDNS